MGRHLVSHVHVLGDDGAYHIFGPDDDVPAEFADKIGDHAWINDDDEGDSAGDPSVEPPRSGAGSGVKAWAAFADQSGYDVEGQSRDEIVQTLVAAGVISE